MEELERATTRLRNIRSVQPMLGALRTIALGGRSQGLNRARRLDAFREDLARSLVLSATHAREGAVSSRKTAIGSGAGAKPGKLTMLVVGTERGYCGAINEAVADYAMAEIDRQTAQGTQVTWMALGSRLVRTMKRHDRVPAWSAPLPLTALPPLNLATSLTTSWLASYDAGETDAVDIVALSYGGMARHFPTTTRVLPPPLPEPSGTVAVWPPIMETDPRPLFLRTVEMWIITLVYRVLLNSAIAEHSARYQLMDGADQNSRRLMEELQLYVQMARQQAITSEIQDLIGGAGLLGGAPE